MATLVNQEFGAYQLFSSVTVTSGPPTGHTFDMRRFTRGAIYATSTHGDPVITFWSAASSTGTYRVMKTSTGGDVAVTIIANAAINFPAAAAGAQFMRLTSSTSAAVKNLPFVMLKK